LENNYNEKLKLSYSDPLVGVFLRTLAWEVFNNKGKFRSKDITTNLLQIVRSELGLKPLRGGAPQEFINGLIKDEHIENIDEQKNKVPADRLWNSDSSWRLLYCPMHGATRKLSELPVINPPKIITEEYLAFNISLRNPIYDNIRVFIGNVKPTTGKIIKRRGIYILGLKNESFYIGQTTEFGIRAHSHFNTKEVKWWIFFSPEKIDISKDSLDAAESLLITYWNEISNIHNRNRGSDQKPDFIFLQQGIIFAQSCSAIFIWLAREFKNKELFTDERISEKFNKYFESVKELIVFKKRKQFSPKNYLEAENLFGKTQEFVDE